MRHINKSSVNKPEILALSSTYKDVEGLVDIMHQIPKRRKNGDTTSIKRADYINSDIYNGNYTNENGLDVRESVKTKLKELYYGKCAYCERHTSIIVEHYRPKLQVIGETEHLGYFWLAYEWTNLVVTCDDCNIGSRGGKGNKFPIIGNRIWLPIADLSNQALILDANSSYYLTEQPYLIHPEIDNPISFFAFQRGIYGEILITGLDEEGRGRQTIYICNLNREPLSKDRWDVVYNIARNIERQIKILDKKENDNAFLEGLFLVFEELEEDAQNEEHTFTLLRKYVIQNADNFEHMILPNLNIREKELIFLCFQAYKNGTLL